MSRKSNVSNTEALSNPGISRCMDVLTDLLHEKAERQSPRWIADLDTLVLSERQADGSYRDAYKITQLNAA